MMKINICLDKMYVLFYINTLYSTVSQKPINTVVSYKQSIVLIILQMIYSW